MMTMVAVSQSVLPSFHTLARSPPTPAPSDQPPDRFSSVIILKRKCGGRTDGRRGGRVVYVFTIGFGFE